MFVLLLSSTVQKREYLLIKKMICSNFEGLKLYIHIILGLQTELLLTIIYTLQITDKSRLFNA